MTDNEDTQRSANGLDLEVANCIERALMAPADADLTDEQKTWREVWGRIPQSLHPVAPAPATWGRIRTRLDVDSGAREPLAPTPANDHGWLAAATRWAAVLIVGLLVTAAWLGNQVRVKTQHIAQLQSEMTLSTAGPSLPVVVPAVSADGFAFVTANGVESCDLEARGNVEGARGWLIMGGKQPSCFLAVEGLQPLAEGQVYRAWFRSDGQAVPMGVVELEGGRGEMFSPRIPPSVDAVFVTVESVGEPVTAPKGPTVLYGDSVVASL